MTLYNPTGYSEYIYAWFDWNQNGSFSDAGEQYTVASATTAVGPHNISISVPATVLIGSTRMRVMVDYNNSVPDPCRTATWGESEDYCVTITGSGVLGCTDSTAD